MAESGLHPDVERRINEHLEAIDRALVAKGVPLNERRSITGDVEAQIRDMLATRAGSAPTLADLEAVFRKLDAPESYAEDAEPASVEQPHPVVPAGPIKFSRTAVVGAAWAPLFFIFAALFFLHCGPVVHVPGQPPPGPSIWQVLASVTTIPLGLFAPFGVTILGWLAVSQIRRSNGHLCGLGLALADGLLFPLLTLNVLIYIFWRVVIAVAIAWKAWGIEALGHPNYIQADRNISLILVLAAATALFVDWLIAKWAWRKVRPPITAEAGKANHASPSRAVQDDKPLDDRFRLMLMAFGFVLILLGLALPFVGSRMWPHLFFAVLAIWAGGLLLVLAVKPAVVRWYLAVSGILALLAAALTLV